MWKSKLSNHIKLSSRVKLKCPDSRAGAPQAEVTAAVPSPCPASLWDAADVGSFSEEKLLQTAAAQTRITLLPVSPPVPVPDAHNQNEFKSPSCPINDLFYLWGQSSLPPPARTSTMSNKRFLLVFQSTRLSSFQSFEKQTDASLLLETLRFNLVIWISLIVCSLYLINSYDR